jgi:hypothetical protein
VLGYSAVAIAAFTFYADRTLGWEATTSPWIIIAVGTYFVLNSLLTVWIWAVEAGEVFAGKRKTGETVRVYLFCQEQRQKANYLPSCTDLDQLIRQEVFFPVQAAYSLQIRFGTGHPG